MLRLATGHLEDGDRPKYPHRIISCQVLIANLATRLSSGVFRCKSTRLTISSPAKPSRRNWMTRKPRKRKRNQKAKAHKAFNVLSFGAEAEEEEEDLVQAIGADKGKSKSAHDLARYFSDL